MPTLEWIGKEKVINHDKEVPFKTVSYYFLLLRIKKEVD